MSASVEFGEGIDWPDLSFALTVRHQLTTVQRKSLEDLVLSWYEVGSYSGYGGVSGDAKGCFHYMTELQFTDGDGMTVRWEVDMGSASAGLSVEVLQRCLGRWADDEAVGDVALVVT